MKKYIITILMAVVATISVSAQQKLVLKLEDGTIQKFETWQVDSLYFEAGETASSTAPDTYVDLGFAKWAPYNLGATKSSEAGWLVGWGDVTGTNQSTRLKFFPAQVYSNDIYETAYDIAHTMWGGEWRLPTDEEMLQLMNEENCEWTYDAVDNVPGWRITSKIEGYTDKSIFLPFTGYRNGTSNPADTDNSGLYWTGTIGGNTEMAKALFINETDSRLVERDRFLGLAIRPIYGKFVHPLALTAGEPTNITVSSVTIPAEMTGDATAMATVSKIGFCFGKANETVNPSDPTATNKTESDYQSGNTQINLNITDLLGNTAYKAVVYLLLNDNSIISSDTIRFTTLAKFPVPESGVRLGSMNIEWAPFNIGESTEWGNSHLYGWGDADGENTSTAHGSYAVGLNTGVTSICGNDKYDIAAKQWGNGWRMPTMAELKALYNSSDITVSQVEFGSKIGYLFTDNTGASILIPACGARYGNETKLPGTYFYWTGEATYNSVDGWKGRNAYLLGNTLEEQSYPKFWGMAIRPVRNIGSGNNSGNSGSTTDSRAVDLGLSDGTLWAKMNVGANSPTDYGDYFAWGEAEARTANFDQANYAHYDTSTQSYAKIGTDANDINGDWLICGDVRYDAAAKSWQGKWCMPTDRQIQCLLNECSWEWKSNYNNSNHNGYLVTGPNGNSIFLPAAGKIGGNELTFEGTEAYYWSGALNTLREGYASAFAINFTSDNQHYRIFTAREIGRSIRPVMKP